MPRSSPNDPAAIRGFAKALCEISFLADPEPSAMVCRFRATFGGEPDLALPRDVARLLSLADNNVWVGDPEDDVCEGNDSYVRWFEEWSAISRGAFLPDDVTEYWDEDEGTCTIEFRLGGRSAKVVAEDLGDWMDPSILPQLNRLVAASGRRFESHTDGNFMVVVCVTPAERDRLRREFEFPFDDWGG